MEGSKVKTCKRCREERPLDQFAKCVSNKDGLQNWCKSCHKINQQKSHKSKETARWRTRKHRYGITKAEYEEMLHRQSAACDICGDHICCTSGHVDHCHTSGKVRGLLCRRCNRSLGLLKDSRTILLSAVAYLEKHHGQVEGS